MSTALKLGKQLRKLADSPTVLGTAVSAALHGFSEEGLLQVIVAYANSDGANMPSGLVELLLRNLGEIQGEETEEGNKVIQKASQELLKSWPKFRAAMTWLCSAKSSKAATPTLEQLGKVEWGRYPLIDKASEDFVRYFENHGLKHFRSRLSLQDGRLLLNPRSDHFVDLFCACILDTCLARRPSEMAIKICPRCSKFFASERKQFCSTKCQQRAYWTPERHSADKWVRDLEKFSQRCKPKYGRSIEDLQKRLAQPKVIQRLESIRKKIEKGDWAGWTRLAKTIEAIERLAVKPRLHR